MNPWLYFLALSVSNTLLSYSKVSWEFKGWVFALGVLLPWVLYLRDRFENPADPSFAFKEEPARLNRLAPSVWIILFFLSFLLRFYKLTSFYFWPGGDEGQHGFLAIDLAQKWNWQFFYTMGEHPPLLIWSLRPFFLFIPNPFFDLWFLPALLSILAVPFAYFAARCFFPKFFSLLCGCLMAFSYWPLYSGRFCHQGTFIPFWELSSFALMGLALNEKKEPVKKTLLGLLGFWAGLGSLTFPSWEAVLTLVAATIGFGAFRNPSQGKKYGFYFGVPLLLGLSPFLAALLIYRGDFGHHLLNVSQAGGLFPGGHSFLTPLSYITCLFWGPLSLSERYGPVWGGALNPLFASCFFIGFAGLLRNLRGKISQWTLAALFLCLLPGLLSADDVEFFRIIQAMPIVLLVVAWGIQALLTHTKAGWRFLALGLLLAVGFGLDIAQLWKPRLDLSAPFPFPVKTGIPDENFRAFQVLEDIQKQGGPGLVFTDFLPLVHGHTLYVAVYPFNAASNPGLRPEDAKWAAILAHWEYEAFLLKRFPGSKWTPVGKDLNRAEGITLGIVPLTDQNRPLFQKWLKAASFFHSLQRRADGMFNNKTRYRRILEDLPSGYGLVQGDPFLESVYGEWVAQYYFGLAQGGNMAALERAIRLGYPAAHLYRELGNFYFLANQPEKAKQAYQTAEKLDIP